MIYEGKEKLFLNADKDKLVKEDSPEAAFLFAAPGDEVDDDEAKRLGLSGKKQAEPAANKAASKPATK
jgi:hypothetical protein